VSGGKNVIVKVTGWYAAAHLGPDALVVAGPELVASIEPAEFMEREAKEIDSLLSRRF
jgi:hypothetical protein